MSTGTRVGQAWKRRVGQAAMLTWIFSQISCGAAAKQEHRSASLAEATRTASAFVEQAREKGASHVQMQHQHVLDAVLTPLLRAESSVHAWFVQCLQTLEAVTNATPAALQNCREELAALHTERAIIDSASALFVAIEAEGSSESPTEAFTRFIVATETFLDARMRRYERKTSHESYAAMIDAHNDWVAAQQARRAFILAHPEQTLQRAYELAREATEAR